MEAGCCGNRCAAFDKDENVAYSERVSETTTTGDHHGVEELCRLCVFVNLNVVYLVSLVCKYE